MINAEELSKIVGANVRRLRNDRGWSQADLAEKVGISSIYVSNVENGKYSVSSQVLYTLADVFKVNPNELRQACEKVSAA